MLLLPAAWWLTRPHLWQHAGGVRAWVRRLPLAVVVVLAILATLMFTLISSRARGANTILLPSYALAPGCEAVLIIVLLGILARAAAPLPHGPSRWWARVPQWLYGGVLLLDALAHATVNVARTLLLYDLFTPAKDHYLPESWLLLLQPIWILTQHVTSPLHLVTVIALLIFVVLLFRRTRFVPR